jgi:predicted NBD/HSP70 family sugar kinase
MYIIFDIGGTKMRVARSENCEDFGEPVVVPTPSSDFHEGMRLLVDVAKNLAKGERIQAIAGGVAGPLDHDKTMLVGAPNIAGWINKPLAFELQRELSCKVLLQNDTAIVGLGEAHHGAGAGQEIVAYMTVSTGVGAIRIVNGLLDRGRFGFEVGHHIINMDVDETGNVCKNCTNHGDLESYISGTAFTERYNKKPYEVESKEPWQEAARILAVGLNNIAVFWSPDIIVLGGSMIVGSMGPVIPFDRTEEYFKMLLTIFPKRPQLAKATLGDLGGLHGALVYLKQSLSAKIEN